MIRYYAAALALKAFSLNSVTKTLYRNLGNKYAKRGSLDRYVRRGNMFLRFCHTHDVIRDGAEVLELGTGWLHWFSIFLRLHYNVRATMFDVWDNRQFDNLVAQMHALRDAVAESNTQATRPQLDTALLDGVLSAESFDDLYSHLDLKYVVDPSARLDCFSDSSFDLVFSADTLEHIDELYADDYVRGIFRILKPGGHSLHYIACDDHLAHHDPTATPKTYLAYSERVWQWLFRNDVQYFNRLQKPDWLISFVNKGFKLIDLETDSIDISNLRVSQRFQSYKKEDLACTVVFVLHQKPL